MESHNYDLDFWHTFHGLTSEVLQLCSVEEVFAFRVKKSKLS